MKTSKLFAAVLFAGTATLALSLPASAAPLLSDLGAGAPPELGPIDWLFREE